MNNSKFIDSEPGSLWFCNDDSNIKSLLYFEPDNQNSNILKDYNFIAIDRSCAVMNLGVEKRMQTTHNFKSITYNLYKVLAITETGEQKVGWIQQGVLMKLVPYNNKTK